MKLTTLTDFILEEERRFSKAKGSLTLLLTHIENAGKLIASHVRKSGLADILGKTDKTNVHGEQVQKLDEYANMMLSKMLLESGQVHTLGSEEHEELVASKYSEAPYDVYFDPLDGSSNIDVNVSIGTIFSIYRHVSAASSLPLGKEQVAAGYILYGSSVMFVYSTGSGVNGFTYDGSSGLFLLSHPSIKIPSHGSIYSLNEAYYNKYDKKVQTYLDEAKTTGMKARYIGSLVADVHRTLLKGGVFLYPGDSKNPSGKLRLMYEVNPMSYLIEQAGGLSDDTRGKNPLHYQAESVHQRIPVIMGSQENVETFLKT